jgi:hypothetical protein
MKVEAWEVKNKTLDFGKKKCKKIVISNDKNKKDKPLGKYEPNTNSISIASFSTLP